VTKIRSSDSSRMDDARGMGGGGGGGFPGGFGIPGGLPVGGGLLGVIVLLASLFLPKLMNSTTATATGTPIAAQTPGAACTTPLEQVVCGVTNDVQDFWSTELPTVFGVQYEPTRTRLFDQPMPSGCGTASPETGPFYCPVDRLVYIDLGFMQQIEQQFVGATSDLAEQYIVAHEYGHHIQNLLGTNDQGHSSVSIELQADCYAGVWVGDANRRGLLDSPTEIQEAIKAAEAVGDDRIQQATTGRVDPETWTHGSAAQRHQAFITGFDSIDPKACAIGN